MQQIAVARAPLNLTDERLAYRLIADLEIEELVAPHLLEGLDELPGIHRHCHAVHLVASFIFVQQMREAFAEQDYQSARTQVLKAQARAAQLGLDTAEYSDLQRQELTTAAEVPPSVTAPFNEERIAFFSRAATQETD